MTGSLIPIFVRNSIEKINYNNGTEITEKEYFSVLLLILKFHPHAAPLYLAFLFKLYLSKSENAERLLSEIANLDVEESSGNAVHIVPEDVLGRVEYVGQLFKKEEELFQIIIKKVSLGKSCDLRVIYEHYLDNIRALTYSLLLCIFPLSITALSWLSHHQ